MPAKTKKPVDSTLATIGKKVKSAAKTVADKAEEYVVEPVGKALGLKDKKKTEPEKPVATKKKPRKKSNRTSTRS